MSCTRVVRKSSGHPPTVARGRRSHAVQAVVYRCGAITWEPVTSFDLFASAHWTILTKYLRIFTSSRCQSNRGCSSPRECLLSNNTTIARGCGRRKASLEGAKCSNNARILDGSAGRTGDGRRSPIGPCQSRPKTARFSCGLCLLSAPCQEDAT